VGPKEHAAGQVTIRDLRTSDDERSQRSVALGDVVDVLADLLKK
jgi:hypothetical protein